MLLCQQIAVLALCICGLACLHAQDIRTETDLEEIYRRRTPLDWARVWYTERHSRCRRALHRHMYWACEVDIHRKIRYTDKRANTNNNDNNNNNNNYNVNDIANDEYFHSAYKSDASPTWLRAQSGYVLLRTRRRQHPELTVHSITSECCTKAGCNWEEYAEYCPSNQRNTHD